jgi:uncharacterized protein
MFIYPISLSIAAGAALINIWLMIRVGRIRTQEKISVGDGGNERLIRRMRAHSNYIESAPFVLILLFLTESALGSSIWLWAVGLVYLLGRVAHSFGMDGLSWARMVGTLTSMATLLGLAITALYITYATPISSTTEMGMEMDITHEAVPLD